MEKTVKDYRLYLVTDRPLLRGKDFCQSIEQAIIGGVTFLQLREKSLSTLEFYRQALQVKALAAKYNIPFVINDRLDIALAVDADGLHIGQDDMPLEAARRLLGPEKIIGVSAATVEEAVLAEKQGADYLGVGAVFATATKTDADTVSLEELRRIKQQVTIPVVAIGGINESNVQQAMAAGIDGVSVVSAILGRDDIQQAANQLFQLVSQ
ncbi:MAG: thiamine phosphate synthase [Veillonellales bacterium]